MSVVSRVYCISREELLIRCLFVDFGRVAQKLHPARDTTIESKVVLGAKYTTIEERRQWRFEWCRIHAPTSRRGKDISI